MIPVVKLNDEQWVKIEPYVEISEYGPSKTYFKNIEDIINADKLVTLNGKAMWKKSSTNKSIAERIKLYHKIFELPDGTFAVSSQTFNQEIYQNDIISIDRDQIKYYDITMQELINAA